MAWQAAHLDAADAYPGHTTFVDYSGKKPHIVDALTGEVIDVELFVAALGASSCTFAEASYTQQLPGWIASNTRAVAFFGGVMTAFVSDQLEVSSDPDPAL